MKRVFPLLAALVLVVLQGPAEAIGQPAEATPGVGCRKVRSAATGMMVTVCPRAPVQRSTPPPTEPAPWQTPWELPEPARRPEPTAAKPPAAACLGEGVYDQEDERSLKLPPWTYSKRAQQCLDAGDSQMYSLWFHRAVVRRDQLEAAERAAASPVKPISGTVSERAGRCMEVYRKQGPDVTWDTYDGEIIRHSTPGGQKSWIANRCGAPAYFSGTLGKMKSGVCQSNGIAYAQQFQANDSFSVSENVDCIAVVKVFR